MRSLVATVALVATILAIQADAAAASGNPEKGPGAPSEAMAELLASPTLPFGHCAPCVQCDFDKYRAPPGTSPHGWSNQQCDWGGACLVPCIMTDNTLTPEQMKDVSDRVLTGMPEAAVSVVAEFEGIVRFNRDRASLQFDSCSGKLAANLPLTPEQVAAVLAED